MLTKNFYISLANYAFNMVTKPVSYKGAQTTVNVHAGPFSFAGTDTYSASMVKPKDAALGAAGVFFGDGDVAPTVDDYTLSGNPFTTFDATYTKSAASDNTGQYITVVYTITNTGSAEFTIREVGLFGDTNNTSTVAFLVERTVLDTPVTIPAGGVGQVTYTIRFNYPTA